MNFQILKNAAQHFKTFNLFSRYQKNSQQHNQQQQKPKKHPFTQAKQQIKNKQQEYRSDQIDKKSIQFDNVKTEYADQYADRLKDKLLYKQYLQKEQIQQLLNEQKIFKVNIRIFIQFREFLIHLKIPKNPDLQSAQTFLKGYGQEVSFQQQLIGQENQNRAINGSTVFFQIHQKLNLEQNNLNAEDHIEQIEGEIVGIEKISIENQNLVGYLTEIKESLQGQKNYFFRPINRKLPVMYIYDIDQGLQQEMNIHQNKYTDFYFSGQYVCWEINSSNPMIKINSLVGKMGDIEIECKALLQEHEIYTEDFSTESSLYLEKFEKQFKNEDQFVIPASERAKRLDLTKEIVFTIDPSTARDLDDALSIRMIDQNMYEIGVHIADVSYFVDEKSPIDEEARLRTTSVYLVHKVLPMLPQILCENLCSLNPGIDKLAYSVFFKMTSEGEVIWDSDIKFKKSIIKSCVQFSYDIVQDIIDGKYKTHKELPSQFQSSFEINYEQLFTNIKDLHKLGMKRRELRTRDTSLSFEKHQIKFELDQYNQPIKYSIYERNEAMFTIEEFMLIANQLVAKKIVSHSNKVAILRAHEFPKEARQKYFINVCRIFNHDIDFSSQQNLRKSLDQILSDDIINDNQKKIIKYRMIKMLEAAQYFVVESTNISKWYHFALNFDCYTHFTSPIRRYPDILVHRLLEKCELYGDDIDKYVDNFQQQAIMDKCNEYKLKSRRVSDGCEKIFMCLYLKKNQVTTKGILYSFGTSNMTIIVPEFQIEKDIYYQDISSIISTQYTPHKEQNLRKLSMQIQYNGELIQKDYKYFDEILIKLSAKKKFPIDYKISLAIVDPINQDQYIYLQ